ncbi:MULTISPECIES: extracellular solute-binding protein [unclassified Paenibacillus]|uniref:sugar ABC transporter substrate-binding protein n=1 Tax=unclassified Paenibacillus TaxID=185978 RepID=UPI001AE2F772|nr:MULTISPECIES: extracellular solute-binding protein [unclassified Paenibacillus]MBP1157648.1 trehalose transport system substrate-binding protein [Paenibacillus sp. PvP091]MBP1171615.1 trehalose transport system substrate-binding protein [Paenibacillus sp. PvR098]MBP2437996.1 trehalose transport system substrate-binding protein [Paenibacillus sp. PvP052]
MNTSMKKLVTVGLSTVMVSGIIAGCAKSDDSGNTASSESKTLRVTMALSEEEWAVMRKEIIPQFEQANNAKVEAIQVEAKDVVKKLEAMKQAGKMEIDLIAQDVNNTASLVSKGLVEDLSAYKSKIPSESIGKLVDAGDFEGKTYFLPYRPNVEINYYNEKKFNQYGLTPPTTWDELLHVAKTLKEKEQIGRLALKIKLSGDVIEIVEFIRQAGGDPLVLNDEGTIKAYTFLQELWPYLSEDTLKASFSSTNGFLAQESVYYAPNWPFGVNIIVKEGGKTEIKANSGYSGPAGAVKTLGGEVVGIPVGSPNKELAVSFMEYLMSKEVQETMVTKLGWPSFRSDVYGQVEDWQKPYFEATQKGLEVAVPLSNVPYWADVNKAINESLKEVVIDRKDVKTTLDKYAAVIQKAKSDYENK